MPLVHQGQFFSAYNIDGPADWELIYNEINIPPQSFMPDRQKFDNTIRDYFVNICKAIIVETKYTDKDYRDTYYNFFSKKFAGYKKDCIRLNFFNNKFDNKEDIWRLHELEKSALQDSLKILGDERAFGIYIGNVVLRPLTHGNISRSIVNATCVDTTRFLACRAKYETNVLGSRFQVNAFPFMNQDTDVSQCAMTALWATLRYYSEKYTNYREIYPFEISQLSHDVSGGRILPAYQGLTIYHLTEALANYGFEPVVYVRDEFSEDKRELFFRYLHYYIESGIPLIIGFAPGAAGRPEGHAVAVFGHLKDNELYPCANQTLCNTQSVIDTCCYNKGYIINDDNWMPYQLLLKRGVNATSVENRRLFLSDYKVDDVFAFVVPLYEKIYLYAEHVDTLARRILCDTQLALDFNSCSKHKLKADEKIVLRVYLTSSRSYKDKRRHTAPIGYEVERAYISRPMPKFVWIAEISTEEMYLQGKIMGEIIFDATANKYDMYSFLYIHYPGVLITNNRDVIGDFHRIDEYELPIDEHMFYNIYSSNLKSGGTR